MLEEVGKVKVGVLDVQGSVIEHARALREAGAEVVFVKTAEDLEKVSGLVMPGGESTTIGKLLRRFGLREAIIKRAQEGMPIYGTCAGAILLAKEIEGEQKADKLGVMDIVIERNAYGGQLESVETEVDFDFGDGKKQSAAIFIRAPRISKIGEGVNVLAEYEGDMVAVRDKNLLVTTFHPELTEDIKVHQYFLEMCRN